MDLNAIKRNVRNDKKIVVLTCKSRAAVASRFTTFTSPPDWMLSCKLRKGKRMFRATARWIVALRSVEFRRFLLFEFEADDAESFLFFSFFKEKNRIFFFFWSSPSSYRLYDGVAVITSCLFFLTLISGLDIRNHQETEIK